MNISIQKPCHENWDAMTPNQQGAFCGKCVKTVIDFSTKSLEEIKSFFENKQDEKVCGRFESDQLSALSFDAFFNKFKRFNLTKRFAVIIYFTFGMWLFGSSSAMAQTSQTVKGDVKVENPIMGGVRYMEPKKDTVTCIKPKPNRMVKGKVAVVKHAAVIDSFKLGEVQAMPQKKKNPPQKKASTNSK